MERQGPGSTRFGDFRFLSVLSRGSRGLGTRHVRIRIFGRARRLLRPLGGGRCLFGRCVGRHRLFNARFFRETRNCRWAATNCPVPPTAHEEPRFDSYRLTAAAAAVRCAMPIAGTRAPDRQDTSKRWVTTKIMFASVASGNVNLPAERQSPATSQEG